MMHVCLMSNRVELSIIIIIIILIMYYYWKSFSQIHNKEEENEKYFAKNKLSWLHSFHPFISNK